MIPDILLPSLMAAYSGSDLENADMLLQRWRVVMIKSFNVIVTGGRTTFMDFVFLPSWLDGCSGNYASLELSIRREFEDFIASFMLIVGDRAKSNFRGGLSRCIHYHKLEEVFMAEGTFFPKLQLNTHSM